MASTPLSNRCERSPWKTTLTHVQDGVRCPWREPGAVVGRSQGRIARPTPTSLQISISASNGLFLPQR
jgi:hypothetical protein